MFNDIEFQGKDFISLMVRGKQRQSPLKFIYSSLYSSHYKIGAMKETKQRTTKTKSILLRQP